MEVDELNINENSIEGTTSIEGNETSPEEDKKLFSERRKLVFMLSLNLLNFHRAIITSRRRSQQRICRRRNLIRGYFMQQMLELQNSFIQLLPIIEKSHYKSLEEKQKLSPQSKKQDLEEESVTDDDNWSPRFYEDTVSTFTTAQWLSTFRVTQATFRWLCAQLHDALKPNGSSVPLKNLISLEKRVALALYAFATGADYREIADLFEVSRTSVCKFMKRFAEAVIEHLGDKLIAMPTSLEEYDEIRQVFYEASNMPPLVVGVLGQCEIPVYPIAGDVASFMNEDGNPTIVLQVLVDNKLLFRKVFMETKRTQQTMLLEREMTKLQPQDINGRQLPCFLVAPASYYPLRPWLLRQYTQPLDPHEHDFNDAIEQLLEFKERAFRRLFARWHILQRKCDLVPKTMEVIATACCALHNLLEETEDGFFDEWGHNIDETKFIKSKYKGPHEKLRDLRSAVEMRDYLARTISSTEM